jgi:hypothetical protein
MEYELNKPAPARVQESRAAKLIISARGLMPATSTGGPANV